MQIAIASLSATGCSACRPPDSPFPAPPGALFFWSYELLVYMVLLNFLLAIIVDAFSEVKEKTHETVRARHGEKGREGGDLCRRTGFAHS